MRSGTCPYCGYENHAGSNNHANINSPVSTTHTENHTEHHRRFSKQHIIGLVIFFVALVGVLIFSLTVLGNVMSGGKNYSGRVVNFSYYQESKTWHYSGEFENTDSKKIPSVKINFVLKDGNGAILETSFILELNIQVGEKRAFSSFMIHFGTISGTATITYSISY